MKNIKIFHLLLNPNEKFICKYRNFIIDNINKFDNINHIFIYNNRNINQEHNINNDRINSIFIYNEYKNINIFKKIKLYYYEAKKLQEVTNSADKIVIHSLFGSLSYKLFIIFYNKNKKFYIIIWGADIYNYFLKKNKKIIDYVTYILSKKILRKSNGIITLIPGDYEFIKKKSKTKAKRFEAFYPNIVNFDQIKLKNTEYIGEKKISILLGNSASDTNEHFEAIDFLKTIKNKLNIKVICPLSYGNMQYAKEVAEYGKNELGASFVPLMNWLEPKEYAKIINSVDIAIMNHKRQQAIGNIIALLYAGKKVYIRKSVSTYGFLKNLGVIIFDVENLYNQKKNDLLFQIDQNTINENREIIRKYFSEEHCIKLWNNIFNS